MISQFCEFTQSQKHETRYLTVLSSMSEAPRVSFFGYISTTGNNLTLPEYEPPGQLNPSRQCLCGLWTSRLSLRRCSGSRTLAPLLHLGLGHSEHFIQHIYVYGYPRFQELLTRTNTSGPVSPYSVNVIQSILIPRSNSVADARGRIIYAIFVSSRSIISSILVIRPLQKLTQGHRNPGGCGKYPPSSVFSPIARGRKLGRAGCSNPSPHPIDLGAVK